jgi:hypothetical protein
MKFCSKTLSKFFNHKDTKSTKSRNILCVLCAFVVLFFRIEPTEALRHAG